MRERYGEPETEDFSGPFFKFKINQFNNIMINPGDLIVDINVSESTKNSTIVPRSNISEYSSDDPIV